MALLARFEKDFTDDAGNVLEGNVNVTVTLEGGGVVSLYDGRDSTTANLLGDPFVNDGGRVVFHVAGGAYRVDVVQGALTRTLRYVAIGTAAEKDYGATGGQVLTSATPEAARTILSVREKMTANRTYYVRTDGSDSNTGLVDSAGGAFLTLQNAIDTVAELDVGSFTVTIDVGNGTYSGTGNTLRSFVGRGSVIILGDETTPSNVVISTTGISFLAVDIVGQWHLRGVKLTSSANHGLFVRNAQMSFQNVDFGAVGASHNQIGAFSGGKVIATGNYSISGAAGHHMYAELGGVILIEGRTVTITGTPAFATAFANSTVAGVIGCGANTYSGSATGKRYNADGNGVVRTYGAATTYLPGNAVGTTATGGQYI